MLAAAFVRMLPEATRVHAFLFVLIGYVGLHRFQHTVAPHVHSGEQTHPDASRRTDSSRARERMLSWRR
jgi:hypothetical protein